MEEHCYRIIANLGLLSAFVQDISRQPHVGHVRRARVCRLLYAYF
jgi:hypothetical protein